MSTWDRVTEELLEELRSSFVEAERISAAANKGTEEWTAVDYVGQKPVDFDDDRSSESGAAWLLQRDGQIIPL